MKCCICKGLIEEVVLGGKEVWKKGSNAQPVKKGRCCMFCNETKVIPARIKDLAKRR